MLVAFSWSGKYSAPNRTGKMAKWLKKNNHEMYKKWVFKVNREWKETCICFPPVKDDFGLRNVCLLFSLWPLRVSTPGPTRWTEDLWTLEESCWSKLQSVQAAGRARSLFNLHPSCSSITSQIRADSSFFTSVVSNGLDRHFLWAGLEGKRHSWAKHLHFLPLLTLSGPPFFFYTLLLLSTHAQGVEIPRLPLLCVNNSKTHKVMASGTTLMITMLKPERLFKKKTRSECVQYSAYGSRSEATQVIFALTGILISPLHFLVCNDNQIFYWVTLTEQWHLSVWWSA